MARRASDRKLESAPPSVTPIAQPKRSDLFVAALLFAGTLVVYAQVWGFGFVTVDDHAYVTANPYVLAGFTWRSVVWSLTAVHDCNWIPLTWLSLMLDRQLYGLNAGGYHGTNVFLHAASACLLFAALAWGTGCRGRSAFVAALFALHPLHVESVAWIAERKDVLSTFFGLLSLLVYVRYCDGRGWKSYAISFFCFCCSLLSKQTLVTFPFVLLLLDFWPLGRLRPEKTAAAPGRPRVLRLIIEKIPFFTASAAFSTIAMVAQSTGGAMAARFPLKTRVMNAVVVYAAYLEKTISPQKLAFYYPHPGVRLGWVLVGVSAGVLLAITVAAILGIRRAPYLFVGWFWYVGTLIPMIGLVQIGIQQMADRYTYFPLIGIFLALTWSIAELVPAGPLRSRALPVAAIAGLLLLTASTFSQITYWHDSVTLLRHSMECTPESSHAHELLADALLAEGDLHAGVDELEKAIRLAAPYAPLHYSLAAALERLGRTEEAERHYRMAISIDPTPSRPAIAPVRQRE